MKYQNTQNTIKELKRALGIVGHGCTIKEASKSLELSPRAIYYRIKKGKLTLKDGLIPLTEIAKELKIRELIG